MAGWAGWAGGHAWCTVHVAAYTTPGALPALSISHACMCTRGCSAEGRSPSPPPLAAACSPPLLPSLLILLHSLCARLRLSWHSAWPHNSTPTAASNAGGRVLPPPPGFALLQQQPSYQHFARGLPLVALSRKCRTFRPPHSDSSLHNYAAAWLPVLTPLLRLHSCLCSGCSMEANKRGPGTTSGLCIPSAEGHAAPKPAGCNWGGARWPLQPKRLHTEA